MKTLAERLDDLKAKLSKAKTDEERKPILDEIDELSVDAKTMGEALTKANDEAKTSREEKETTQKENDTLTAKIKDLDKGKDATTLQAELIAKLEELNKDKESETIQADISNLITQIKGLDKGTGKEDEIPAWAKPLVENINLILKKDTDSEKSKLIIEALKEQDLPESMAKLIVVDGDKPEEIKKAVEAFKQTMNDEKLLTVPIPKPGEKTLVEDSIIKDYAEKKNNPEKSSAISGKTINLE